MIHLEWRPYTAADGTAPKTPPVRLWQFQIATVRRVQRRTGLSARAPECQKLKMVGWIIMAKCKSLTGSAVKGLISN